MFTIDLLKGRGIPIRSRPAGLIIAVITMVLPTIVTILILSYYFQGRILLSVDKQKLIHYDVRIKQFSKAVEQYEILKREKKAIANSLAEIKSSIGRHTHWSGVLLTLAQNLPESVVLTQLDAGQDFIKKKVPNKADSKKKDEVTVPVRRLRMNITGDPQKNCDQAIKDFRDQLRLSAEFGSKVEEIRVSQQTGVLDGRSIVNYEIYCIFKEGS